MDAKEVIKILKKNGFTLKSQKGSHSKYIKDAKTVIVPVHAKKDIPIGTLKNIELQSGIKIK
ncbi:MAG: type II toxin-antitoxin system HicA family toxin [Campylobacterota bacterium]|nr:type II toxin-antitoxin system HicA family toxin [Campylobacterota bacterium]